MSATISSASSWRSILSVRQSLASSMAERSRLPRSSSSLASKREKSAKASAEEPAKPASTSPPFKPADLGGGLLHDGRAERDLAVGSHRHLARVAHAEDGRRVPLFHREEDTGTGMADGRGQTAGLSSAYCLLLTAFWSFSTFDPASTIASSCPCPPEADPRRRHPARRPGLRSSFRRGSRSRGWRTRARAVREPARVAPPLAMPAVASPTIGPDPVRAELQGERFARRRPCRS